VRTARTRELCIVCCRLRRLHTEARRRLQHNILGRRRDACKLARFQIFPHCSSVYNQSSERGLTYTHLQVIFLPELEGVIPDKTTYTARVNELTSAIDDEVPPSTLFPPPSLSHFSARSRCTSTRSQICGVDNSNPLPLVWTPFSNIYNQPQPLPAPPLLLSISPSAHPL